MSNLKQLLGLACFAIASPALAQNYVDFGGMYGFGSNGSVAYPNPYTNATSCPSGYTAYKVLGTPNIDNPVFFCGKITSGGTTPVADFGGMFGFGYASNYPNPITGGFNCPAGYTATRVLGTTNVDYSVFVCHKAGTANSQYRFGGMYGYYWDGTNHWAYNNPLTGAPSCLIGHTSNQALGTTNIDYELVGCYRKMY
ncbi:MAG TPA: hypothetical protein VEU33_31910 [Archangium sp.]|nr:hypothetical protein [Archangium sp.]